MLIVSMAQVHIDHHLYALAHQSNTSTIRESDLIYWGIWLCVELLA